MGGFSMAMLVITRWFPKPETSNHGGALKKQKKKSQGEILRSSAQNPYI
jgi:hypothetical protein